jgi:hypothetical protein
MTRSTLWNSESVTCTNGLEAGFGGGEQFFLGFGDPSRHADAMVVVHRGERCDLHTFTEVRGKIGKRRAVLQPSPCNFTVTEKRDSHRDRCTRRLRSAIDNHNFNALDATMAAQLCRRTRTV